MSTDRVARRNGPAERWLALAVLAEGAIALVDALSGEAFILTTAFLLPVLALALVARPVHVGLVAALGFVLAILSGVWDDYFLSADHVVRLSIIAVGSTLALLSARARMQALADRGRIERLAQVARISDAATLEEALERLGEATVPGVADLCWVELVEEDGTARRVFSRGPAELGAGGVVIPLTIRMREVGRLGLAVGPGRRPYDDDDRAFFGVLAGRVALALANTRLLNELSRTRERLDRILGSLAEAVTVHDRRGKVVYANEAAVELLGAVSLDEILRAEPGELGNRFIVTDAHGEPIRPEQYPGRRLMAGDPDAPPMLTHSVRRDTGREYWFLTKATLLHDEEGETLAVNVIEDVTEAKESELRQRFLDEAGQVLASSLDYQAALQRLCELAVPGIADWCAVDLAGRQGLERVAIAHADPSKLTLAAELLRRYPADPDAPTGAAAVLRTGVPERYATIPDAMLVEVAQDPEHLDLIRGVGLRSAMVVPMTAGEEVLGVMTFASAESGRSFDEDDFAFAQDLARRAATAVQNGRLYAEQVRVAHTLQSSLLPDTLPVVPGWEAGASYQAGEERAEVGGDFYDVVPARDGHLVFLGDVTGKGVEAAALTALVRHSAQMAARFETRPSALLTLVNSVLRERPGLAPVSLVCALVESSAPDGPARVTIAAAGHPLPLLRRVGEPPVEAGRHDVLLGVVDRLEFAEATVEVGVGDVMLFYTDGVIDAPGEVERFGEERLRAAIEAAPPDPSALLHTIEAALRAFAVREGADDRAMLALRYTGARVRPAAGTPVTGTQARH